MRYKSIPFIEIEHVPSVAQSIILPRTEVQYIPVLICPDDMTVLQDTSDIIDFLEKRHPDPVVVVPAGSHPLKRWADFLVEAWSDEWMVIWAMHYRWSDRSSRRHIYYEFGRRALSAQGLTGDVENFVKAGEKIGDAFSGGSLYGQGITSIGAEACERSWEAQLKILDRHFSTHPYLFGDVPSIADFALNGPYYGHLYRDPIPGRILRLTAPAVADWTERTSGLVPSRSAKIRIIGADPSTSKDPTAKLKFVTVTSPEPLSQPDIIPATIRPLFHLIFIDFIPHMLLTMAMLKTHIAKIPADARERPLRRTIGGAPFTLTTPSKVYSGERRVYPYAVWMMQRSVDAYEIDLDDAGRAKVDEFLAQLDRDMAECKAVERWAEIRKAIRDVRVKRVKNELVVDWERIERYKTGARL
ncbi:hypothetical protein HDU93_007071 [Gonapodya sp. JEL0774]|nr:hypothetical protein HDU93_007071 [Gonapodya sp. JEL0774]